VRGSPPAVTRSPRPCRSRGGRPARLGLLPARRRWPARGGSGRLRDQALGGFRGAVEPLLGRLSGSSIQDRIHHLSAGVDRIAPRARRPRRSPRSGEMRPFAAGKHDSSLLTVDPTISSRPIFFSEIAPLLANGSASRSRAPSSSSLELLGDRVVQHRGGVWPSEQRVREPSSIPGRPLLLEVRSAQHRHRREMLNGPARGAPPERAAQAAK